MANLLILFSMNHSIYLLFFLLFCSSIQAQDVKSLSLTEALDLAIKNRKELTIQQIKVDQARADINILNARRSFQIKASGDVRYNPVLQTSIIPGAAFQTGATPG